MSALTPAHIVFDADGDAHAPDFGDRYHPRIGAEAQARHVFLAGNALPSRWAGAEDFTILETGFGLGNNFLATWDAWRRDPARGTRLHYASIDAHPPQRDDLRRAHASSSWPALASALQEAWPPLTPGLHAIDLDEGRVRLLLAFGDAMAMQRQLDLAVDAFYLDGFAPDRNPAMWQRPLLQGLARKARAGATLATWSVARQVREGLQAAGFEVERASGIGGKREVTRARFAPRPTVRTPAPRRPASARRHALVIGAGLAGAWAAEGLRAQGWRVTVLDRHRLPAQEASGNPAGLFHATVHADDGVHARLHRAAALLAAPALAASIAAGQVAGAIDGLLRLAAPGDTVETMRTRQRGSGLPDDFVQALDAAQASERAGIALHRPAWCFMQAGWVDPGALVAQLLRGPGIEFRGGADAQQLQPTDVGWAALDGTSRVLAKADVVVLAGGADASRLAPGADWPIGRARGQLSWWRPAPAGAPRPRLPIAGDGYLITMPDGALLCGATTSRGDDEPALREGDHAFNVDRLARLCGWRAAPDLPWQGRVGWRVLTPDRLPIVGPVPGAAGLFVLTALGSRGIGWGPLAGRVLAAWVSGAPMPIEARLRDAIDPSRWARRAARRG